MYLTLEERLQSDIVRKFSELYPCRRGQLFAVPNERVTKGQLMKAKSIGIFSGVSDLIYIGSDGYIRFLELKVKGSRHNSIHLEKQCSWGSKMIILGYEYRFITSVEDAIDFINGKENVGITVGDMRDKIKDLKSVKI